MSFRRCSLLVFCLTCSPPLSGQPSPAEQEPPPIDREVLGGVEDGTPVRNADENYYEARAYNYLLVRAQAISIEQGIKHAERNLTFAHLFEEPARHRGRLVHVAGRLRRVRIFDAPRLAADQGIKQIYESWIFDDFAQGNPTCVVTVSMPPSIEISEKTDQRVELAGYFFKRYRYKASDGWRDAPLLIGPGLRPLGESVGATSPWTYSDLALPLLLSLFATSVLVGGVLTWWFRRGDRLVKKKLEAIRPVNPFPR